MHRYGVPSRKQADMFEIAYIDRIDDEWIIQNANCYMFLWVFISKNLVSLLRQCKKERWSGIKTGNINRTIR